MSHSIYDFLGYFLVVSVLFLPFLWLTAYSIWAVFHWKEIVPPERESTVDRNTVVPIHSRMLDTRKDREAA